jgi:hypothetical protein
MAIRFLNSGNISGNLEVNKSANAAVEIAKFKVTGTGGSFGAFSFVSILPGSGNYATQLRLHTNNTGNNFQSINNNAGVLELATNDNNPLVLKTNSTTRLTISNVGAATFTGLVSGITPTAAANFVTKAYADGLAPGAGVFLPLAGGTLTGATATATGISFTVGGHFNANSTTTLGGAVTIEGNLFMDGYNITSIDELSASTGTFAGNIIANKLTTSTGLEYQVRNTNGSSGNHVFKSFNTVILTLDGATNASTFAGNVTITTALADTILTVGNTGSGGVNWKLHSASSSSPYAVSSGDFLIRNASSTVLNLQNNGNAIFAGNVGIGVAPFAASLGGQSVIDLDGNGSIWGYNNSGYLISNAYYNSGWKYKSTGTASVLQIGANGGLSFRQAPSGAADTTVTLTEPFIIDSSGRVGIGTDNPGEKLEVNGVIQIKRAGDHPAIRFIEDTTTRGYIGVGDWAINGLLDADLGISSAGTGSLVLGTNSGNGRIYIINGGNVGIGTTNPQAELEVAGRVIVEKLEVARYSDANAPAAVYVGRLANPMGAGGVFRLGTIVSSSTENKIDEPFLITYSSGHWGCQPMFFAEFTVTYYRGSYIKYWAQHEVSGSRLEIVDGPYGGQIISGGAPVSRTITQLCTNCHGGQPVYKCVWKWSNSGTYIKSSPIVSLVDGHGSARVYTSGSSSESAIDTLLGSAGSPGPAYLLMGIDNAQAAGFTGLQTQN